jgi:dienelactone hydrolase
MIKNVGVPYNDEDVELEGFVAYSSDEKRPLVLLCHAWKGRDDFICEKAKQLAERGFIGFAIDVYGKGVIGNSAEENAALKKPFLDDRSLLQRRLLKRLNVASALPHVDHTRIAVIGFGFGGLCALDLGRCCENVRGVVSIYGHFNPPKNAESLKTKVLILHGYNDPISPITELEAFQKELEKTNVDWQAHLYSNTTHAFATPSSQSTPSMSYNPLAAKRAWQSTINFLNEVLF